MTVECAKARIPFGRAIGSFQATKQRLAEMLIRTESAKSAAYAAIEAAASNADDVEHVAAVAALTAGEAYTHITAQTVQ
jgi:acyl-CoA dehydrogenase